jgi:hypothetical protein
LSDPLRGKSWAELKEAIARGEIRFPTSEELMKDLTGYIIFDEMTEFSNEILNATRRWEERMIRDCLGRWVSELEPMLMYQNHRFIGLGLYGDLSEYPKIYVERPDDRYIQWWTPDGSYRLSSAVAHSVEAEPDAST